MKTITTVLMVLLIFTNLHSQQIESIGAGVIDFLLTNPKTANRTNASEQAALVVIGNLLNQSAQRKHEVNVAKAGRDEIVINANNGNQATLYSDNNGNVYLLSNGKIYPISSSLVNQAKSESVKPTMVSNKPIGSNSNLPDYNLEDLKNEFKFEKEQTFAEQRELQRYYMSSDEEFLSMIASKNGISIDDIYFEPYKTIDGELKIIGAKENFRAYLKIKGSKSLDKHIEEYYNSQQPLERTQYGCNYLGNKIMYGTISYKVGKKMITPDGYFIYTYANKMAPQYSTFKFKIVTSFTCNWAKDFGENGWDLEDFQGIKRSFYDDENMLFVLGYTSNNEGIWRIEIYEAATGKTIYSKKGIADHGGKVLAVEKEGEKLPPGEYIFNFTLKENRENPLSKSEKFEIIKKIDIKNN